MIGAGAYGRERCGVHLPRLRSLLLSSLLHLKSPGCRRSGGFEGGVQELGRVLRGRRWIRMSRSLVVVLRFLGLRLSQNVWRYWTKVRAYD